MTPDPEVEREQAELDREWWSGFRYGLTAGAGAAVYAALLYLSFHL